MLLQLALDCLDEKKTLELIDQTQDFIDIIEIGTPLIKFQGSNILKAIRKEFPKHKILVDLKTMDAGEYEAAPFFDLGASFVTVLGVADTSTIKGVIKAAEKREGKVIIDLIAIPNKISRIQELEECKNHFFSVHTGIDQQLKGENPLADLKKVISECDAAISVAGGINLQSIGQIAELGPDIIVVGGAITGAQEPGEVAKQLRKKMEDNKKPKVKKQK